VLAAKAGATIHDMPLPRIQSIELNDQPWVPAALRDTVIEALSLTLKWGRILEGLVDPFAGFLREAGTRRVLDLGAGAGAPGELLASALAARGTPVDWILTDLFPRPGVWRRIAARVPTISHVDQPIDATAIPGELSRDRARTLLNVLHHFPRPLARAVIRDAIESRAPIFIAEGFERTPLGFLPFAPLGVPALYASPLLARDRRLARILLTWVTPAALAASIWDGFVSTLRVYTEPELREMAEDAPYRWTYGNYRFAPFGKGYYFYGVPIV